MTAGTGALLVLIGGGAAGIAALTRDEPRVVAAVGRESPALTGKAGTDVPPEQAAIAPPDGNKALGTPARTSEEANRTATREPRTSGKAAKPAAAVAPPAAKQAGDAPPAAPVITTQTQTETREIPFQTRLVRDPALPRGSRKVETEGIPGVQTLHYLVTLSNGRETDRRLLDSAITRPPQHRVIAFGARGWGGRGWGGRGRPRECGPEADPCLLGRSACPDLIAAKAAAAAPSDPAAKPEESAAIPLGGSPVDVLDEDLTDLDPSLIC